MPRMTNHRTARVPNEPFRAAGMTIPQVIAMTGAFTMAAAGWWALGHLHVAGLAFFFARSLSCGLAAGLLGLLAYAAFDADREPLVRQALGFTMRRHVYHREDMFYDAAVVSFPARPRAETPALARLAGAWTRLVAWRLRKGSTPPR